MITTDQLPFRSNLCRFLLILCFLGIFVGLAIGIHKFTSKNSLGHDFYFYWNSTRAFVFEGLNPYSSKVAMENQIGLYGHLALNGQDPAYFRNPAYSIVMILPLTLVSYDWAYSIWVALNIFLIFLVILVGFPKLPGWITGSFFHFYQIGFGLIMGNFSIVSGLAILLFIGLILIQGKSNIKTQIIIGILLTISTYKPQLTWLFLIWILIFSLRKRLYPLIISFFATLFIASFIMLLYIPTWPLDFIRLLMTYQSDANVTYVRSILFLPFFKPNTATIFGIALLAFAITAGFYDLYKKKTFSDLDIVIQFAFIGLATILAHPAGFSNEQICLIIPVIAYIATRSKPSKLDVICWIGLIILSYGFFFADHFFNSNGLIIKGPVLAFMVWLGIIIFTSRKKKVTNELIN